MPLQRYVSLSLTLIVHTTFWHHSIALTHAFGGPSHAALMFAICCVQAAECIAKGQEKYNAGDRMGALKFFEQSLQKVLFLQPTACHDSTYVNLYTWKPLSLQAHGQ